LDHTAGASIMKRRQAFTLVELLVSLALIIFIMSILSQAFIAALGTFRNLKGQGDLAEKLRSTVQILQRDLGANHFESNRRLSDPTFWNNGPPQQGFFQVWHGPLANPAATWLGTQPVPGPQAQNFTGDPFLGSTAEGSDPSGIASFRSINHTLAFTVHLVGNNMGDFMSASGLGSGLTVPPLPQLPGGIASIQTFGPPESRYQSTIGAYNYQWAEVEWFLKPQLNPNTNPPLQDSTVADPTTGAQALPLYTLYRRQRLLVPDNNLVTMGTTPIGGTSSASIGNFLEMSCWVNGGSIYFNNPSDVTMPNRRLGLGIPSQPIGSPGGFTTLAQDLTNLAVPLTSPLWGLAGSDIQMNDVVSFDVRLLPLYPTTTVLTANQVADPFVTLLQPPFTGTTFNYSAPTGISGLVFDTWSSINDGINDYSQWNLAGTLTGGKIPYWTPPGTTLTYQYPVGALGPNTVVTQTLTTPITGSGPIIRAVQITLRIWDYKTNQSRQVTIVQAL
jgi:type II secretory pathway pseudopilin PulG